MFSVSVEVLFYVLVLFWSFDLIRACQQFLLFDLDCMVIFILSHLTDALC